MCEYCTEGVWVCLFMDSRSTTHSHLRSVSYTVVSPSHRPTHPSWRHPRRKTWPRISYSSLSDISLSFPSGGPVFPNVHVSVPSDLSVRHKSLAPLTLYFELSIRLRLHTLRNIRSDSSNMWQVIPHPSVKFKILTSSLPLIVQTQNLSIRCRHTYHLPSSSLVSSHDPDLL